MHFLKLALALLLLVGTASAAPAGYTQSETNGATNAAVACAPGQFYSITGTADYGGFGENIVHRSSSSGSTSGTHVYRFAVNGAGAWNPANGQLFVPLTATGLLSSNSGTYNAVLTGAPVPTTGNLGDIDSPFNGYNGLVKGDGSLLTSAPGFPADYNTVSGHIKFTVFESNGDVKDEWTFTILDKIYDCCDHAPNSWWNNFSGSNGGGLALALWGANGFQKDGSYDGASAGIDVGLKMTCVEDDPTGEIGGDPHVVGFLGQKFNVLGEDNAVYNFVSSPHLQYNARFNTTRFTVKGKHATNIAEIGLMVGSSRVRVAVTKVSSTSEARVVVELDGRVISPETRERLSLNGDSFEEWLMRLEDGTSVMIVTRDYDFTVKGKKLSIRPHLDDGIKLVNFLAGQSHHGLLGQTARPTRVQKEANKEFVIDFEWPSFLDGSLPDYEIVGGDIFGTDFPYNLFDGSA